MADMSPAVRWLTGQEEHLWRGWLKLNAELASTLQRVPVAKRGEILKGLIARAEDAEDPNLPFMVWYALEPVIAADAAGAPAFLKEAKIPFVRQSITRRMATRD